MKAMYVGNPIYCAANERGHIQLSEDFLFTVDGVPYWVPKGYVCDGASIPRPFWSIVGSPFDPEKIPAAIAHDSLYLTHAMSRSDADEVLFQLLLQSGCRLRTARTMWGAVRAFARFAWKNSQKDKIELLSVKESIRLRQDAAKFNTLWFSV